jgi:molybdopterin biosynthesis enzyme MoaB
MIEYGVLCIEDQPEGLAAVRKMLPEPQFKEVAFETSPDENASIRRTLRMLIELRALPLVLTIGGAGVGIRERVPEVTLEIIEREIPGIAELARLAGIQKSRRAALWRGVAGYKGKTLVINLPDWETAIAIEAIMPVLPITIKNLHGQ